MASLSEPIKGVSAFLVITLIVYFGYSNIISGILDWANTQSSIIGAMGWIGFIMFYIICAPLYMFYTFIAGSKGHETKLGFILAGFSSFFFFLIIAVSVEMLMGGVGGATGMINSLSSTASTMTGEDYSSIDQISWVAVLIAVLGCIGAPLGLILMGYGQLNTKELAEDLGLKAKLE